MNKTRRVRGRLILSLVIAVVLFLLLLPGCTGPASATTASRSEPGFVRVGEVNLPEDPFYQVPVIFGRDVPVVLSCGERACDEVGWDVSFVPGRSLSPEGGRSIVESANWFPVTDREIELWWHTTRYSAAVEAGKSPEEPETFTLFLTETTASGDKAVRDRLSLVLDNVRPVAHIFRACDSSGNDCYDFEEDPHRPGGFPFLIVSKTMTDLVRFYGLAADQNFEHYEVSIVGTNFPQETLLCRAAETNTACSGEWSARHGELGYGTPRETRGQRTLDPAAFDPQISDNACLLALRLADLSPGAYALKLSVYSQGAYGGEDPPYQASYWVSLVITP